MDQLQRAYARIGDNTPLKTDCGQLCGAVCCNEDADGQGGVYLFPQEEVALGDVDWGEIDPIRPGQIAPILHCDLPCPRDRRPLGCRIFPLTPCPGKDGLWSVRMDIRANAMCPLAMSGLHGLDREFVLAVRDAIRILAESAEGEAFLRRWYELEESYRALPW